MKLILISDLHYIAESMITDESNKKEKMFSILARQALKQAGESSEADTIVITGDLVNDGDMVSNIEMRDMLRKLRDETGKKIYVLTATHDFHHHRAYVRKIEKKKAQYTSIPWEMPFFDVEKENMRDYITEESQGLSDEEIMPELVKATDFSALWDIYSEFGAEGAYSVCRSAQSYCVDLDDETRMLMLNDCFRNEEALHDISPTFSPECFTWIDKMIKEARRDGKFIFACTHHPMMPPCPVYKIGGGLRDMRSSYTGHILADMGLKLIFTGHSHLCDIGCLTSKKGNRMYDVSTGSTSQYPSQFRLVELFPKEERVRLTLMQTELEEKYLQNGQDTKEMLRRMFIEEYREKMEGLQKPLGNIILSLKLKHFFPLCKKASKLTKSEMDSIADIKFFNMIMNLVLNMFTGDGKYTPDTAEYKLMMGLAGTLDSIIDKEPFFDVKKILKGYSLREVIEPMLYNNSIPDGNAEFCYTKMPEEKIMGGQFDSNAGTVFMAIFYAVLIPASVLLRPLALLSVPLMTMLKGKKKSPLPEKY